MDKDRESTQKVVPFPQVEIRTDASKLCKAHQRPMPEGAEDIGCWMCGNVSLLRHILHVKQTRIFAKTGSGRNEHGKLRERKRRWWRFLQARADDHVLHVGHLELRDDLLLVAVYYRGCHLARG